MKCINNFQKIKIRRFVTVVFIVGIFFFSGVQDAHAAYVPVFSEVGDGLVWAFNMLLYGVFCVAGWTVSLAATLLEFTLNPAAVKTLFDMPAIYVVWQMVRDFFNLFFILTLLLIAFATIFQISKYNYKSLLKTLLLMALLVNFSWPISRFIVDATNVPMYFFLTSMFSDKATASGKNIASVALQTSDIKELILPRSGGDGSKFKVNSTGEQTKGLLVAIIFIFLFGISLTVLGILLLVRTIMLVILIAFSPVGFAGLAIPGFQKYANQWWDELLKYALFGPAAMLVLLAAVSFMKGFQDPVTQKYLSNSAESIDASFNVASVISTLIPVILVWISIGMGQTMGIKGAGAVTVKAQQWSKTAGRKAAKWGGYGGALVVSAPVAALTGGRVPLATPMNLSAAKTGAMAGWEGFRKNGKIFGKQVPGMHMFSKEAQEEKDAKAKGFVTGGVAGYKSAEEKLAQQRARERAEEYKKNGVNDSELHNYTGKDNQVTDTSGNPILDAEGNIQYKDKVKAAAAAMVLSDRKAAMSADQFSNALQALGKNTREAAALIGSTNFSKLSAEEYADIQKSAAFSDPNTGAALKSSLDQKVKKDGNIMVLVEHAASQPGGSFDTAMGQHVANLSPRDLAAQGDSLHDDPRFVSYVQSHSGANDAFDDEFRKNVYREMSGAKRAIWAKNQIQP